MTIQTLFRGAGLGVMAAALLGCSWLSVVPWAVGWLMPVGVTTYGVREATVQVEVARPPVTVTRVADGGFLVGDPDAPVTFLVFTDFACPHCQTYRETVDRFVDAYVASGQAALEFRVMPTSGGDRTVHAARVLECVGQLHPAGFWQAQSLLYEAAVSGDYGGNLASQIGGALGIDSGALLDCVPTADQVTADRQMAAMLGVNGTPAVRVRHGAAMPEVMSLGGSAFPVGGVPYEVLEAVTQMAQ